MIYNFNVKTVEQEEKSLKDYQGKALLIVNTATKCGFTKQYDALEDLYKEYKSKGFEILDFPCNQFLMQAPGSDAELASFCQLKFSTTFQTFAKIKVNGKDASPLFTYLKSEKPVQLSLEKDGTLIPEETKKINWNFTKFLVDKDGNVVERFAPNVTPDLIKPYLDKLI